MQWRFGPFRLDTDNARLWQDDTPLDVRPKSFDVLVYLVTRAGTLVSTEELLDNVWLEAAVGDGVVKVSIGELRKILGETGQSPQYIVTVPRRGYRFIAEAIVVEEIADPPAVVPVPPEVSPVFDTEPALEPRSVPEAEAPAPLPAQSKAERRQLTILFCDLVDSTSLSEKLDPEDLDDVIKAYYDVCGDAVASFEGHIAQYLGDGLLVYFGYPHAHEDAARRAVHAGLAMIRSIPELNVRLKVEYGIQLSVRIGIHTGLVMIGQGRAGNELDSFAVGAPLNIASRIQTVATPNTVWVSETTHLLIQGYFDLAELGSHDLPGVAESMRLYEAAAASESQHRLDAQPLEQLTPFVGREVERLMLQEHWEAAKRGQGRVMVLSGEAGMGKSRLARAMLATVSEESHLLLEGHCSPYHQHTAFYPLVDLLQKHLQFDAQSSASDKVEQLTQLVRNCQLEAAQSIPLLASLIGLKLPRSQDATLELSPRQQRQQTLETLLNLFIALSEEQPVLILLEDAHWLDPSTLDWLDLLVSQGPTLSILTLITSRPEFRSPWSGRAHVTALTLNRLLQPEIAQIVQAIAGSEDVSADVVNQVAITTDGVPLFVEEVTRWIIGPKSSATGVENQASSLVTTEAQIPSTLQDLLTTRLDSVGAAKRTAQLGATVGREFAYSLLQAISPLEESTLQDDLDALVASDLLYQRGVGEQTKYQFKHALIQDAAYQSLLRRTRQQVHAQVAHLLVTRFSDIVTTQPELVAHHYTEAGHTEQAVAYWQRAGEHAHARSAHIEAIVHFRQGIDLLSAVPSGSERDQQELSLQSALGPALIITKGYASLEVEKTYSRAYELCQQSIATHHNFQVLWGLRAYYTVNAEYQKARVLTEQGLEVAQRNQDPVSLVGFYFSLGTILFCLGELTQAREQFETAIEYYDPQQHRSFTSLYGEDSGVSSRTIMARTLWVLGYADQARQIGQEAIVLAHELSHPYSIAYALHFTTMLYQLCQEWPTAHNRLVQLDDILAQHHFAIFQSMGAILKGWEWVQQGYETDGIDQMEHGLAAYRTTGASIYCTYYLALLAEAYWKAGQYENSWHQVQEAMELVEKNGERFWEAELHRLQGELWLSPDGDRFTPTETQIDRAELCFQQALEIARQQEAKTWELRAAMSLGRLWQQQGKLAEARQLLTAVYEWFTEGFDTADLQAAKQLLDELA